VGRLAYQQKDYVINNNNAGPVAKKLYRELTSIQYGTAEDKFGWITSVL
jgi:branched-chain amino acid aminotransferase